MTATPAPNIWVIDDSAPCRRLLSLLARKAGGTPTPFESGEALLAQLAARHRDQASEWPAAVLTDMQLGSMNGLEVTRALRAAGYPGPIAMVTATDDDDVRAAAKAAGVNAVLLKAAMTVSVGWFLGGALRAATATRSAA